LVIDSDEYWNYIHSQPDEKQVYKTVPVPVAVPSFPVEQTHNLNVTGQRGTNDSYTESGILMGQLQQTDVTPSTETNDSNPSLNSSYNSPTPPSDPGSMHTLTNNTVTTVLSPTNPSQTTVSQNSTSPPVPLLSSNGTLPPVSLNENSTYVTIQLLPNSSPLFFECNQTAVNGLPTLPGLNATASTIKVLTDGNPNTQILGNATFDLIFEKPFKDKEGPELLIYEAGQDMESFSLMIFINGTEYGSPTNHVGYSSSVTDDCGNSINAFKLDLAGIGIPAGSSITGLRINNDPDKNGVADFSDITTFR
jgi:hypothetical protein